MKKIFLIIILFSQMIHALDTIEISILTCSVGQEVHSIFGHTAIRVIDREKNKDQVYNFGMFDFDTPNFEYDFLKGKLHYYRGIQKTEDFVKIYTYENRSISEQRLDLTKSDKKLFLEKLSYLNEPENRQYFYSFLEDNCATETRDLLSYVGVVFENQELEKSNRDLINSYLSELPWIRLGINLVLGKSLDSNSTRDQSMFLPDYLQNEIATSTLRGKSLVKSTTRLNSRKEANQFNVERIFSPLLVFSVAALLFLFWFPEPFKIIASFSIGLAGVFILMLWIFSEHEEVRFNLNIFWCNPFYIFYIPLLIKNKTNRILNLFLWTTLIISAIIWAFKIQIFDIAVIPIFALLTILNVHEYRKIRRI